VPPTIVQARNVKSKDDPMDGLWESNPLCEIRLRRIRTAGRGGILTRLYEKDTCL